jgi:hypothetical protein
MALLQRILEKTVAGMCSLEAAISIVSREIEYLFDMKREQG